MFMATINFCSLDVATYRTAAKVNVPLKGAREMQSKENTDSRWWWSIDRSDGHNILHIEYNK